jgi:hypothetical protein
MNDPPNSRESAAKPPRFSIRGLLCLTAAIAIGLALVTQLELIGVLILLVLAGVAVFATTTRKWESLGFAIPAGIVGLLIGGCLLTLPTIAPPSHRSNHGYCRNNLKQIAMALHLYHDTYGSFPPAYVADENGRPMHSWRVLILPFVEQKALYDEYRFDEPWDGPHNRTLADSMPSVYRCPSDPGANPHLPISSYLAVVGPETNWPGEKTVSLHDVKDGTSQTLLVVESHNSGIHWMEPRDLHTGQMAREINPAHGQGICSCHGSQRELAQAALADGSVQILSNDLTREEIEALLTIAGGEADPLD